MTLFFFSNKSKYLMKLAPGSSTVLYRKWKVRSHWGLNLLFYPCHKAQAGEAESTVELSLSESQSKRLRERSESNI